VRKAKLITGIYISFVFTVFMLLYSVDAHATHQRAGYITYKHLTGMTYEITLITYTYTPSPADRPKLEIFWGDGTSEEINRSEKLDFPGNISKNTYVGIHTYNAPGTYTIYVEDKNRNGGVLNIPNSVNIAFYVETTLIINPFLGPNSSPVILNPPIENACVNQPFIYNPAAFDNEGDSLSYKLVICKGDDGLEIPGYSYPLASSTFSLDAFTGDLLWDSPLITGEYNVAFVIEEWRFGVRISAITVDMQILVVPCNNNPPVIEEIDDICVEAGTSIAFIVKANDPNPSDIITLTADGGPFQLSESPPIFPQPTYGTGSVQSYFFWLTSCAHVRKNPYSIVFKAKDNSSPVNLVAIKTVFITIVAPAPQNFTATPQNNAVALSWEKSVCLNASGYKIYRKNAFYGFIPDTCETGVPAYTGYSLIATLNNINDTTYLDNNNGQGLPQGNTYCYMVIAFFSDGAESYATPEVCTELPHTAPIITNVSIRHTDNSNGSAYIAWSKPKDLDSLIHTGPFKYYIFRHPNLTSGNFVLIDSLSGINDTLFIDTLLNTLQLPYSYKIELYNDAPGNRFLIGTSQNASSVFVSTTATNQSINLEWAFNVPWLNEIYTIYRYNDQTQLFDSVGFSFEQKFKDSGLVNGLQYCYKIKTSGAYSGSGTIKPIINFSQIVCDIPIDTVAPCPPTLTITTDCDNIANRLVWHRIYDECFSDVVGYNVYYSQQGEDDLSLIYSTNNVLDTVFIHANLTTIAGCYAVTAIDSFNNESVFSSVICLDIDSCFLYTLPNVFTPDGDGFNDFFIPFPYDFVEKIDLKIYNRWGALVFETSDPDINWDGKNKYSHQQSSQGVYFYVCDVYEQRLGGIKKRTLSGFIHLLRGTESNYD